MDALEDLNKTHRRIFCYNRNIGHLFVPNINARIIHESGGYYVRTNSLGFRSNNEFKEKKGNKPRILFFGDSNTAATALVITKDFLTWFQNILIVKFIILLFQVAVQINNF